MTDHPVRLACPVCDAPDSARLAVRTYIAPFNQREYSLRQCDRCTLKFWTPLQIIPAFYEGEGFAAYEDYHNASRPFPPWAYPFFEKLPLRAGKLLDVGSGDGSFLAAAKSKGFDCFGIDLDEKSVKSAIARFGLDNIVRSALDPYVADCCEH
jgi:2-polyprenyl-3-methyl-5-hydroxy-6-metoxy-1,4-benzoquinol methylase